MNGHLKRRRQKQLQFEHQKGLCCWCLSAMNWWPIPGQRGRPGPQDATWEHLVPKSLGGVDARRNRVLAHEICNRKRGTKPIAAHFNPFPRNWRGEESSLAE